MQLNHSTSCPLEATDTLKNYFGENRSRLLDIAAFLDRVERSKNPDQVFRDPLYRAFTQALECLINKGYPRAERVQMILSDLSEYLLESDQGQKCAQGAPINNQAMV